MCFQRRANRPNQPRQSGCLLRAGDVCIRSPTKITIRAATAADAPIIAAIYSEAVLNTTASYDYELKTIDARMAWFDAHVEKQLPVFVAEMPGYLASGHRARKS